MAHIQLSEAQAWCEGTKLVLNELDVALETQAVANTFARMSYKFDTSTWSDETTTPELIRNIIAQRYVGWLYLRTYSEDAPLSEYGNYLLAQATVLEAGILDGTLVLGGNIILNVSTTPTNLSFEPDDDEPSFSMGEVF